MLVIYTLPMKTFPTKYFSYKFSNYKVKALKNSEYVYRYFAIESTSAKELSINNLVK